MPDPLLIVREGDPPPFDGVPRLNGYAILPREIWDRLDEQPMSWREGIAQLAGRPPSPSSAKHPGGYFTNGYCDPAAIELFKHWTTQGRSLADLKGYAIVPVEYLAP